MSRTTVSLVCYKSDLSEVTAVIRTLREDRSVSAWVVVDNGTVDDPERSARLRELVTGSGGIYVDAGGNFGFGAGHNSALKALQNIPSEFHLMLNPDIVFEPNVIPALMNVMKQRPDTALIMPRVLYPDQTTQYLCKLLPTPLDFALRRFAPGPLKQLAKRRMDRYELRSMDNDQPAEVPFLSGCFMFTRRTLLEAIGGFDEGYFLYMEDVDLCRRLSAKAKLLYWPDVRVLHRHERGSHNSWKLTFTHIASAIRYFNRWGWFLDARRRQINRAAASRLLSKK